MERARVLRWARVRALAGYPSAPGAETLVLQLGENPTTDYYLRPRLERGGGAWRTADLRDDPAAVLTGDGPLRVVFCRYASGPWLSALERIRPRLASVAVMLDDDLAAMPLDPGLPLSYRAHVLGWHGRWTGRLSSLASAIWVSTPVLAERYATTHVLPPLPEADPPEPDAAAPPVVIYPGQALHRRERAFVLDVARRVAAEWPDARFEVTSDTGDLAANVTGAAEQPWPIWRADQHGRSAALCLAPLFPSVVNAARAPVKMFDAARVGAAGLYAEGGPYEALVRDGIDGLILPMRPEAWSHAIAALLARPERRLALARAAASRLRALRVDPSPLPP